MAAASTRPLELSPDLETARALVTGGDASVVPLVHTWVADTETPVSAFLKLRGEGPAYLLESAEQGGRLGRHSFLGFSPRLLLRWVEGELLEWEGGAASASDTDAPTRRTAAPDPYGAVADRLADFELAAGFCHTEGLLGGAEVRTCRYCAIGSAVETEFNQVEVDTGGLAPAPRPRLTATTSSCGM